MAEKTSTEAGLMGVHPYADPAWVAQRDEAGQMTDAEADKYYAAVELDERHQAANKGALQATGSAVVTLLETVWDTLRKIHPELPEIVIVTGSGWVGSPRWGHFRAAGWAARAAENAAENTEINRHLGEMFVAGETLSRGGAHTLETMIHEAVHVLARVRGIQDTSRQGRWHNAKFKALAEELGLVFSGAVANLKIGYSEMILSEETTDRYSQLITDLDNEINLVIKTPVWAGDSRGGERAGSKPAVEKSGSQIKATCLCDEPRIIRMSRKVLDGPMIVCHECDGAFIDR